MMAPAKKKRQEVAKQSVAVMPLVAFCGLLISACVAFGNPVLWTTNEQAGMDIPEPSTNNNGDKTEADPSNNTDGEGAEDQLEAIGTYQATSQSDNSEREVNITLAAEAIGGTELAVGETFSFNDAVGDTEHDERYQLAPVVYGSDMAYARGGGICQVSTALYIAALYADLEIVERHAHSLVVDYASIGLDATLVYGVMDLKIKNTTNSPIRIVTEAHGQTVTVTIMGVPRDDGVTVRAYSKIISVTPSDNATTSEVYEVESYREYIDKDGKVINAQYLDTDVYEVYKDSTVLPTEGGFDATK